MLDTDSTHKDLDMKVSEAPTLSVPSAGEPSTSKPTALPTLSRLDLRDNCIDPHGSLGDEVQTFEPVICMRTVKR